MGEFVLPKFQFPALQVAGSQEQFPIRRVFCVGRNYSEHAREMGHDPDREPPFFFMKPNDAIVPASGQIPYPPLTSDLHHEVELVIAIGLGGKNIKKEAALDHVWGYSVGVDLTRRDLQAKAKSMGRPWDWAKGFDASGPCASIHPVTQTGHPSKGRIWLEVNGELRQEGDLSQQIWSVPEIVAHASQAVQLKPGDLIFTGTPAGVGSVNSGDRLRGGIEGVAQFEFEIL
ncbi:MULTISPECIES: fumarylacetoacetate hydrolase family protein [Pseudomonas]|uniref:fumarylacetoacetate hydrolase family protein n=1 Tax=Pseudomonas TaxID=286 RepID=UPI00026FCF7D|nr:MULTISPECIES: fumarylacetoacetate hydrolase family protein [Pseudomonas]EJN39631.1 2-keto-4-pentenoate hydratase/2-oxohepta-3-ene-1,7-dioic acid hydratase [Pseudomonas sp. GM84]